ncbi:MAG TPA: DUF58 domain-containing protein [Candidatus Limnocylindrales bacterium]|nr:DUF58 domain-containing protein [Candidatus Limnocylindrales bacterium]
MRLPRLPLITALVLLLFFAYITGIRQAYFLLYALLLIFLLSWAWSRMIGDNLTVERISPEGHYQVGDPFEERFTVQNRSWVPVGALELVDFSSLPGYDPGRVFALKGHKSRRWTTHGEFKQRGLFTFGPVELRYGDPFGLFPRTLRVPGSRSVVVYPILRSVSHLEALAPSVAGDEQVRGRVIDLPPNTTTIREYVPTDSFKRIHWSSSARLGRLMSRSFETREGGDAWIVLDLDAKVHAGQPPNSTLEYGISLAASIADSALRRGAAVGLLCNDRALTVIEAARGDQQRNRLLEEFTLAQADGTVALHSLLEAQREHWRARGGMIVITASGDPAWVQALLDLGVRGHRNLVVYLDPRGFGGTQASLPIVGRWSEALSWWIVRGADELEPSLERRVANL